MSKCALMSVSDKREIVGFAKGLKYLGYQIISTGGTAKTLREAGIEVTPVAEVTGFPEMLEGRVKTLHPKIHGGILARKTEEHMRQLADQGIEPISLVVVNLYPFRETVAQAGVTLAEAIENIDIGGPSMVRAAAKNYERVTVVVNPDCYNEILEQLRTAGEVDLKTREKLALEAFTHTASYDLAISNYLGKAWGGEEFPQHWFLEGEKIQDLRYGENPHQKAAFYGNRFSKGTIAHAEKLQGKELSYNNIVDMESAWSIVTEFTEPAAVIVKHTNPCGASIGLDLLEAYIRAFATDPISAFGGIVGLNQQVDKKTALEISKTFLEVIIAPGYSEDALKILAEKKNLRLLQMGEQSLTAIKDYWIEPVSGGFLVQERDTAKIAAENLRVVTRKVPTEAQIEELLYAWKIVKHVKSNAIVITKDKQILGVGAGQMNRVGAARIAIEQAKEQIRGAILASDAYFPFSDTVEAAAKVGITAIIQPGGSIRDEDVIAKADEYGITMVFTGIRHFKH